MIHVYNDCNVVLGCTVNPTTRELRRDGTLGLLDLSTTTAPLRFHTSGHVVNTAVHVASKGGVTRDRNGRKVRTPRLLRDPSDAELIRDAVMISVTGSGGRFVPTNNPPAKALRTDLQNSLTESERHAADFDDEDAMVVAGAVIASRLVGQPVLLVTEDRRLHWLGAAFASRGVTMVNQAQLYSMLLKVTSGDLSERLVAEREKVAC